MVNKQKQAVAPYSNKFVRELKILIKELDIGDTLSEKSFRKFRKISAELSSRLPNLTDTTICEIDDILYPDEDTKIPGESKKDNRGLLATSCFQLYHYLYARLLIKKKRPHIHILDNTYLQLMENTSEDSLNSGDVKYNVFSFLFSILQPRIKIDLGIGLKFLKVALYKDIGVIDGLGSAGSMFNCKFVWLSNLQKIPEAKDPQQKRLAAWLARQSTEIFSKFDLKSIQYDSEMDAYYKLYNSLNEENLDANYINLLLRTTEHEHYFMLHHLDHLYSFFKSAKNEEAKLKRLGDFLKGVLMSVKEDDGPEDLSELFVTKLRSIVTMFGYRFSFFFYWHPQDDLPMCDIERYQKYKIEPYLSESSNGDPRDLSIVQLNEEEDSDSSMEDIDYKIMPDYTIEKFFYYDEFMRSLELMSIIRTAFSMHETIFKRKVANEAAVFRRSGLHRFDIKKLLVGGRLCGCNWGWHVEVIMRECSFLMLPDELNHMKQDLIRLLKGQMIDVSARESLYFAINSFVVTGGPYDHPLDDN